MISWKLNAVNQSVNMGHSDSEEVSKDKSEIKKIVIIINIYIAPIISVLSA